MFDDGWSIVAKPPANGITQLHASSIGRVDDLHCDGNRPHEGPRWAASKFHFLLPLAGAFVWHVGHEEILVDPNQALYVTGDEEFRFSHPLGAEHSLVITPKPAILDELSREGAYARGSTVRSASRASLAGYGLQLAVHRLRKASTVKVHPLDMDEILVDSMQCLAGAAVSPPSAMGGSGRRTIERAKAYLHAYFCEKISLSNVATAADVSPVYFTYLFRRAEGVPLYQYLLKLRLAAALAELPGCEDITGLALDLGFSSHSHFSAAFRSKFGISPSSFREELTGSDRQAPSLTDDKPTELAKPLPVFPLCVARGGRPDGQEPITADDLTIRTSGKDALHLGKVAEPA